MNLMDRLFGFLKGHAALALTLASATLLAPAGHAQAASCDNTTLNGKYVMKLSGTYYDNQFNFYLVGALGSYSFDGNGGITGGDTFSNDGTVARRTVTGSYTVNPDCTGTIKVTGSDKVTINADIVVSATKNADMVGTDDLTIFTGTLTKQ